MDRPRGEIEIRRGWQMAGLLGRFFAQFGRPSGPLGRLAGYLMARLDADDRWVVDLLDVQPHDRVLDIGFGPGLTIALIAERCPSTLVAGVDPSEVMRAGRRERISAPGQKRFSSISKVTRTTSRPSTPRSRA